MLLTDTQINAALAERAMGCPVPPDSEAPSKHSSHLEHPNGCWYWSWNPDNPGWHPYDFIGHPAASQSLKEAMRKLGFQFCIRCGGMGGVQFAAEFFPHSSSGIVTTCDSELRAIALACCRALGIEGV